jgi:hypothetical protein
VIRCGRYIITSQLFFRGFFVMTVRTTRSRKRGTPRVVEPVAPPPLPAFARGNPLTHSVTFTDTEGTCWLVYVEPAPPAPALWPGAAIIPGRRLRFDSVDVSATTMPFPAGAPFLQEAVLQQLLDRARAANGPVRPLPGPVLHREPAPALREVPAIAEPAPDSLRAQLADVVNANGGWSQKFSRLLEPAALLFMVVRDVILPRSRG